jgi:hypothetical protein
MIVMLAVVVDKGLVVVEGKKIVFLVVQVTLVVVLNVDIVGVVESTGDENETLGLVHNCYCFL